jgi:hypothetical protein
MKMMRTMKMWYSSLNINTAPSATSSSLYAASTANNVTTVWPRMTITALGSATAWVKETSFGSLASFTFSSCK